MFLCASVLGPPCLELGGLSRIAEGADALLCFRTLRQRHFWETSRTLLGVPGKLAAAFVVQVSVVPKVAEPGSPLSVVLLFPGGASSVVGTLRIDRVTVDQAGVEDATTKGDPIQVNYSGGTLDRMSLSVDAPDLTGFYRVVFELDGGSAGRDELIVQAPPK